MGAFPRKGLHDLTRSRESLAEGPRGTGGGAGVGSAMREKLGFDGRANAQDWEKVAS